MAKAKTVIVADDDQSIRVVVSAALERAGYNVMAYGSFSEAWTALSAHSGDVFISDVMMPDADGLEMLPKVKELRPKLPVIVMSAKNTLSTAVKATERGAIDYLPKPFDLGDLVAMVEKAVKADGQANQAEASEDDAPIVGRSPAMQKLYRTMARVIPSDLSIMLQGESGTGKELVARAIHDMGRRADKPFVAVNMAAIPQELIESELFGHEKGAFTGAAQQAVGRFEEAHGGTLFLDEIGDMPLGAQTRLLRVLQQGEYRRVGGTSLKRVDVRIISATHKNVKKMVETGHFREDLFFRLNVVPLHLPKLSERLEDIAELSAMFLKEAVKEGLPKKDLSDEALSILQHYRWPGNVRELKNIIRRLCVLAVEPIIQAADVREQLAAEDSVADLGQDGLMGGLSDAVAHFVHQYFDGHGNDLPPTGVYDRFLREFERPILEICLESCGGNQLKTADLLGINRNTLRKKILELGIHIKK